MAPGLKAHWPDASARNCLKYCARLRTQISVAAGGAALFLPTPSLDNTGTSLCIAQVTGSDFTTTNATLKTGAASYNGFSFTNLPFTVTQMCSGASGRCISYTIKIRYCGAHLYRCGTAVFVENVENDVLGAFGASHDTAISSWFPSLSGSQFARWVDFSVDPEVEFTCHPMLWMNPLNTTPDCGFISSSSVASEQGSVAWNNNTNITFGNVFSTCAPNAVLQLANTSDAATQYLVEVTAHYEFAGRFAHPFSTPCAVADLAELTHVKSAVLQAKLDHCKKPHAHGSEIANEALGAIMGATKGVAAEVAGMVLPGMKAKAASTLASGIAGLLL